MKLWTTTLVAALILTMAGAAFAADAPVRFQKGRKAFLAAGFQVKAERPAKDLSRRAVLAMESTAKVNDIVARFLQAHSDGEVLDGAKVVGLAHVVKGDIWNITIKNGDKVSVLSVTKDANGTKVLVRRPMDNDKN